ncbi:hypothetical protein IHE45_04G074300 [Dioscorea alata]|uniref:Uncharacterized protein n=1 Tax=Dioscorea alata TaxID=55571 RepID=A0ACB7WE48_DIOAL|nr:hypothetical protein IHE45_04G074300 [Dioscorea alata]
MSWVCFFSGKCTCSARDPAMHNSYFLSRYHYKVADEISEFFPHATRELSLSLNMLSLVLS